MKSVQRKAQRGPESEDSADIRGKKYEAATKFRKTGSSPAHAEAIQSGAQIRDQIIGVFKPGVNPNYPLIL